MGIWSGGDDIGYDGLLLASKSITRVVEVIPLPLDEFFWIVLLSHSLHAVDPVGSVRIDAIPFHPPFIGHRVVRRLIIAIDVVDCNDYVPTAGEGVF